MNMNTQDISEVLIGKLAEGKLRLDQLNADLLWGEYSKVGSLSGNGSVNMAELRATVGYGLVTTALEAEQEIPDNEIQDYLDALPIAAQRDKEAKQLESMSRKWADGNVNPERLREIYEGSSQASTSNGEWKPITGADLLEGISGIDWIWRNWIFRSGYFVIGADEGVGKSLFTAKLAEAVAMNKELPDGTYPGSSGRVLWIETENKLATNLKRLEGWGVDMDRILVPENRSLDLSIPSDLALIERYLKYESIPLAIVDTLSGLVPDENKPVDTKGPSTILAGLAETYRTAIIGTHHLGKQPKDRRHKPRSHITQQDFRGHGGLTQFAQHLIGITQPIGPDDPERVVMSVKPGVTAAPPSFTFEVHPHDDDAEIPVVEWGGETVIIKTNIGKTQKAKNYLNKKLANGPQLVREMKAETGGNSSDPMLDFSYPTMRLAKNDLGIEDYKEGLRDVYWQFPKSKP